MRLVSKILPVVAFAALCAVSLQAQIGQGSLHGKVLDRDGKGLQGAQMIIVSVNSRDNSTLSRDEVKTNKNGDYSISGLYNGKYKVTLMVDGRPVMVKGEAVGDDLFVSDGRDIAVNFDMRNAPAAAPAAPPAASAAPKAGADNSGAKAANDAARKTDAEMRGAFDSGKKSVDAAKAAEAAAATATGDAKKQQFETAIKNYEDAAKSFQLAGEKDVKQHVIFGQLGVALSGQAAAMNNIRATAARVSKKYEEAAAAYQKAIEIKADEPAYFSNRSLALANSGKLDDAVTDAQKAAALNPAMGAQAYYNIGLIFTNTAKIKESVDAFKK